MRHTGEAPREKAGNNELSEQYITITVCMRREGLEALVLGGGGGSEGRNDKW